MRTGRKAAPGVPPSSRAGHGGVLHSPRRRSSSGDGRGPQNRSDRASRSGGFDSRPPPPHVDRREPERRVREEPPCDGTDPRRRTPRTDQVLRRPATRRRDADAWPERAVKAAVVDALARCRAGRSPPRTWSTRSSRPCLLRATSMRPVLNATGVVVHTNLGRAPLSAAAVEALSVAAGATDVELDLATGRRGPPRRRRAGRLWPPRCPTPADVHVVNNGAAALALVTCALAAGREVVVARGELVEIGDGFRIPELMESVGARLREVGTTNRVRLRGLRRAPSDRAHRASCSRCTPRTSGSRASPPRSRSRELAGSRASRWSPTSAPACSRPHPPAARRARRRHALRRRRRPRHRLGRQAARRPAVRAAARARRARRAPAPPPLRPRACASTS